MESFIIFIIIIGVFSLFFISKKSDIRGFYSGLMEGNKEPSLLAMIFSLVTTWIFSRSLLTAAILAYYYGLPGALAYTAYYFSFLTGGYFLVNLRKKYKVKSLVNFFESEYGFVGKFSFSFIITIRLISEIFANLIVIGLIFGNAGTMEYNLSIFLIMILSFSYSFLGGLRNSITTDFIQMIIFLFLLITLVIGIFFSNTIIESNYFFSKINDLSNPGYALILVAFLQIWSYPIHDPVMMDRGFICSTKKTRKSFFLAFLLSSSCIFTFSLLGLCISPNALNNITFIEAVKVNFNEYLAYIIYLLLIVSAISTIDSTLSSAAKLVVFDLALISKTILNGRIVMLVFTLLGLLFIFFDNKDLFTAVAVSGTAATFLTTSFLLKVVFNISISKVSFVTSFIFSISGSIVYFLESQKINNSFSLIFGLDHKYKTLLLINIIILTVSFCSAFLIKKKTKQLQ